MLPTNGNLHALRHQQVCLDLERLQFYLFAYIGVSETEIIVEGSVVASSLTVGYAASPAGQVFDAPSPHGHGVLGFRARFACHPMNELHGTAGGECRPRKSAPSLCGFDSPVRGMAVLVVRLITLLYPATKRMCCGYEDYVPHVAATPLSWYCGRGSRYRTWTQSDVDLHVLLSTYSIEMLHSS